MFQAHGEIPPEKLDLADLLGSSFLPFKMGLYWTKRSRACFAVPGLLCSPLALQPPPSTFSRQPCFLSPGFCLLFSARCRVPLCPFQQGTGNNKHPTGFLPDAPALLHAGGSQMAILPKPWAPPRPSESAGGGRGGPPSAIPFPASNPRRTWIGDRIGPLALAPYSRPLPS